MATYKKRGYKPKTKEEKVEAIEENSTTAEVFNTLDETASKTEEWVASNQKYIFIIITFVAVFVLGYLGYQKFILEPKAEEASNELFNARKYFDEAITSVASDSLYSLALNGSDGKYGMLDIADKFSETPAGNQATYYAGMSYLNMKDYTNAVKYLGDFSSDDQVLGPIAKGGIGDAFVQLGQSEDALSYYEEAAKMKLNEYTTPMYLFKAAVIAMDLGETTKALGYFKRITEEFPSASEATNIDTFIGKAEAAIN